MTRPFRFSLALRLSRLIEHLQPPVLGDLNRWHVGCHIILEAEPHELLAVSHTEAMTVISTDRGTYRVERDWPLILVEPLATVTPIGQAS